MGSVLRLINSLSELAGRITSFLIIVMSLVICFEVVARYIFKSPTLWAHELSAMIFGIYIIFGGAVTFLSKGHVNVDVFYGTLSKRWRAFLDVLTFWFFALFCFALAWKGWEFGLKSLKFDEHSGTVWNPPVYHMKILISIGCFLLLLQGISKFITDLGILFKGDAS